MSETRARKVYDESFKKTIVDLYHSGKGVTELSREYGVALSCIHKWIKAYSPIETSTGETTTNADILKLQKELAKLKEENEILKKAVAIFSKR